MIVGITIDDITQIIFTPSYNFLIDPYRKIKLDNISISLTHNLMIIPRKVQFFITSVKLVIASSKKSKRRRILISVIDDRAYCYSVVVYLLEEERIVSVDHDRKRLLSETAGVEVGVEDSKS